MVVLSPGVVAGVAGVGVVIPAVAASQIWVQVEDWKVMQRGEQRGCQGGDER